MNKDLRAEFERVALPYLDRMYQFALHLTRNRDDASDVVQEAYLRAWRFFGSFRAGLNARFDDARFTGRVVGAGRQSMATESVLFWDCR